ncbi:hypothetical protein WAK64_10870 [Bacillus spongiae]|uniref:Uncharacterized protein n=1 Tax=Bacillus spongiae TaxID=2683610 RepID=A0ABU8HEE6_9BACI
MLTSRIVEEAMFILKMKWGQNMPTLKEFDLDIPYIRKDGSEEDYEMSWKEKRYNLEMKLGVLSLSLDKTSSSIR